MRFQRTVASATQNRHLPYGIRPPKAPTPSERYLRDPLPIRYCAVILVLVIWCFAGGAITATFQ